MDPLLNSEFNNSEENLLTAIAEVSYDDRENDPDALSKVKKFEEQPSAEKGPDSLPDARAKVLHLKRVQRNGENGGSIDRKSDNDEIDEENEETVNFSLDTIIRRGLGEQKINTNFQKDFPDFGSSEEAAEHLTALLHKNPLTTAEGKKGNSSGQRMTDDEEDDDDGDGDDGDDDIKDVDYHDNENDMDNDNDTEVDESVDQSSTMNFDSPPPIRKRGRPKLTDEERERRGIVKKPPAQPLPPGTKRRGRPPKQVSSVPLEKTVKVAATASGTTAVDHLMALGHSLFSEIQPKKRGRKPKRDPFLDQFFDSSNIDSQNESLDTEHETSGLLNSRNGNQIIFQNNELTVTEIPAASRGMSQNALATNQPKKRGRKPKHMISIPIESVNSSMINMSDTDAIEQEQQTVVANETLPAVNQPKKRGRKPKWLLESMNNAANVSQDSNTDFESSIAQNVISVASLNSASASVAPPPAEPKKRGRKPKSYYIKQQQQQYMNATAPPRIEHNENGSEGESQSGEKTVHYEYNSGKLGRFVLAIPSGQTHSTLNDHSVDLNSSIDQEPPLKKKRGRKPKGYYERLAQEESYAEQNHTGSQASIVSIKESPVSPVFNQSNATNANLSANDSILSMPKKRGRKPKSYYLQLEQQQNNSFGGAVESHSTPVRGATSADNTLDSSYGEPSIKPISGGILNHKRVPIPNLKRYEIENTTQMPKQENVQLPKKRGRKPKNYVPENGKNMRLYAA